MLTRRDNVLRAAATGALLAAFGAPAFAQTPVIDGTLDAAGYTRFATQTVNTGFGDNQSELNAGYYRIEGGKLYLMVTGNVESNNNKFVIFFDTKAGGQNVMRTDNPDVSFNQLNNNYGGMTHDVGFEPDYFFSMSRDRPAGAEGNVYTDFSELNSTGGGLGGYVGRMDVPANQILIGGTPSGGNNPGLPKFVTGYNDSNTLGVDGTAPSAANAAAAEAVTTGYELAIDLPQIGALGDFKMFIGVNGASHDYWSNQFLPGLAAPQGNLGGDGLGNFTGTVAGVNFNNFAGDQFLTFTYAAPAIAEWDNAGSGNWTEAVKWTGDVTPNAIDARAVLGSLAGAAARTVTLDTNVSLQQLTFDSAGGYTVAASGANTLTVSAAAANVAISVVSGNHTISAPLNVGPSTNFSIAAGSRLSVTGDLGAAGSTVQKTGDGLAEFKNVRTSWLLVNGGIVGIASNGTDTGVSRLDRLEIAGGATPTAKMDLTNNGMVVDYNPPSPPDPSNTPLPQLTALIASARATGDWSGFGLTSSTAAANSSTHGIGIAEASDVLGPTGGTFMGQTVDESTVLVRYTRLGDANLDGTTGIADFSRLGANFNQAGGWGAGDFNYDGTVGIADFSLLGSNFNQSAADPNARGGAVPEPTAIGLVGVAAMGLIRRRRA